MVNLNSGQSSDSSLDFGEEECREKKKYKREVSPDLSYDGSRGAGDGKEYPVDGHVSDNGDCVREGMNNQMQTQRTC